jgi:hypothetical protein
VEPFDALWLAISEIAVGREGDWIILQDHEQSFSILDLASSSDKYLTESTLEIGNYSHIRLRFAQEKEKNFVVIEGEKYFLSFPEVLLHEIVLTFDFEIVPRQATEIFIDFNAEHVIEGIDEITYKFQSAVSVLSDLSSGSIKGKIANHGAEATIYFYPQSGYVPDNPAKNLLTSMDIQGMYFETGVPDVEFIIYDITEGIYDLVIVSEGYMIDTSKKGIEVRAMGLTDIGAIELIPLG